VKTVCRCSILAICVTMSLFARATEQHVASGLSSLPTEARARVLAAIGHDPWRQLAQLRHTHRAGADQFGFSVAISRNTVVVGAPVGKGSLGAAYVFVEPASGWNDMVETARLTGSDEQKLDGFGTSVSIDGDTVVVGSPCAPSVYGNCGNGEAYVFIKPRTGWRDMTETAKLHASDGGQFDNFGSAVSINGSTIVAGAPGHETQGGAAYVFVKQAQVWKQAAELTASDGRGGDGVGGSVAISTDTVVVGAALHNNGQGAAYVFVKPAGGWVNMMQTAELIASDGQSGAGFGSAIALKADTVVSGGGVVRGRREYDAAYIFVKPPGGWTNATQTAELTAASVLRLSYLSVATNGTEVLVGEPWHQHSAGAVFVFDKPAGGWKDTSRYSQKLTAATGKYEHYFGTSVALTGKTAVIGAPNVTTDFGRVGSSYVFGKSKASSHQESIANR
jgi:hypothetical protein